MAARSVLLAPPRLRLDAKLIVATSWAVVVAWLCALAVWLVARRLAGALDQPASGSAILAAATALWLLVAALRSISPLAVPFAFMLPGLAAIFTLLALTGPIASRPEVGLVWVLVICAEAAMWRLLGPPVSFGARRAAGSSDAEQGSEEGGVPAGLVQRLIRTREGGSESIHALVEVVIPQGDTQGAVHVAFCPPLNGQPTLSAHAINADEAEVRITTAETYGARLEVRLRESPLQPCSVVVEIFGSARLE
jgi:hypothetical protein